MVIFNTIYNERNNSSIKDMIYTVPSSNYIVVFAAVARQRFYSQRIHLVSARTLRFIAVRFPMTDYENNTTTTLFDRKQADSNRPFYLQINFDRYKLIPRKIYIYIYAYNLRSKRDISQNVKNVLKRIQRKKENKLTKQNNSDEKSKDRERN